MNKFKMKSLTMKTFSLILFLAIVSVPGMCLAIEVTDAVVCKNVENKQPVDAANSFAPDVAKVWCWSKIKDGEGTIKHVYYHNGQEMAAVVLNVGSANFRTYSSKKILPSQTGQWRVDIVDSTGNVLKSLEFAIEQPTPVVKPAQAEEAATAEEPAQAKEIPAEEEPAKAEQPAATEEQSQ